jgi:hypothetical protein
MQMWQTTRSQPLQRPETAAACEVPHAAQTSSTAAIQ